jgi:hypothetical protein
MCSKQAADVISHAKCLSQLLRGQFHAQEETMEKRPATTRTTAAEKRLEERRIPRILPNKAAAKSNEIVKSSEIVIASRQIGTEKRPIEAKRPAELGRPKIAPKKAAESSENTIGLITEEMLDEAAHTVESQSATVLLPKLVCWKLFDGI